MHWYDSEPVYDRRGQHHSPLPVPGCHLRGAVQEIRQLRLLASLPEQQHGGSWMHSLRHRLSTGRLYMLDWGGSCFRTVPALRDTSTWTSTFAWTGTRPRALPTSTRSASTLEKGFVSRDTLDVDIFQLCSSWPRATFRWRLKHQRMPRLGKGRRVSRCQLLLLRRGRRGLPDLCHHALVLQRYWGT